MIILLRSIKKKSIELHKKPARFEWRKLATQLHQEIACMICVRLTENL